MVYFSSPPISAIRYISFFLFSTKWIDDLNFNTANVLDLLILKVLSEAEGLEGPQRVIFLVNL